MTRSIVWEDGDILILDQTLLPQAQETRRLTTTVEVAEAIRSLRVRGAPALGIVGAMGVAQAALRAKTSSARTMLAAAEEAGAVLRGTRPTAVNLGWAIDRVLGVGRAIAGTAGVARLRARLIEEALAILSEDERACAAMAELALEFFTPETTVLTHCNTGALVTGGIGTALGAIARAHEDGLQIAVLTTETRPLLQGARLTAWELGRMGVPHAIVVDAAAPGLIARGEIALVITGADRIAANGDVVNKVGTYPLALAAREAGVPFVVVAPTSTIDASSASGGAIEVEERDPSEVTRVLGQLTVAPAGSAALNPAFDVTPATLVTAIVTERGIARPPFKDSLAASLGRVPRRRTGVAKGSPARAKARPKKVAARAKARPKKKATRARKTSRGGGR